MKLRLFALALIGLCGALLLPGQAVAAVDCDVDSASEMDFGRPGAPLSAVATTSQVTVTCQGDADTEVLVCIGLYPWSPMQDNNSPDQIDYNIYRDPAHQEPLNYTYINARAVLTIGSDGAPVTERLTLYGQIAPSQNPSAGKYSGQVDAAMGWSTNTSAACSAVYADEDFSFDAAARLYGECSVDADDLQFNTSSDLGAGNIDAQTTIVIHCRKNTAYRINLDGGQSGTITDRRMSNTDGGPDQVKYQLYLDSMRMQLWGDGAVGAVAAGVGDGMGKPLQHTVYGRVPVQSTPRPGNYTDTVTVQVTF